MELEIKRGKRGNIAWVSWRVLPQLLEQTKKDILVDLRILLLKQGLDLFRGINVSKYYPKTVEWSFVDHERLLIWGWVNSYRIKWFFQEAADSFDLDVNLNISEWRFIG